MRAYGTYFNDCPDIFTRYGKKGRSSLIVDRHEVKFKLQCGLQMVHVRKESEYGMKAFLVVLLTSDMVWNSKNIHDEYMAQKCTGAWDPHNCNKVVDITVRKIIKYIL